MIRLLTLSLLVSPCLADVWRLHDGDGTTPQGKFSEQAGVTCQYYNAAASLPWRHPGGDWIDADGKPQGDKPISSARFVRRGSAPQVVELDATRLLKADGIVLRTAGSGAVMVASRESPTPPVLRLTLQDGSVVAQTPIADSSLHFLHDGSCQATPAGKMPRLNIEHSIGVLAFPPSPGDVVSATLVLTLTESHGQSALNAFALAVPRVSDLDTGARAIPVSADPGIYYHEPWEADDWWNRNGDTRRPDYQWTQDKGRFHKDHSGLWFADGSSDHVPAQGTNGQIMLRRGSGYQGRGLMIAYHPTALARGVSMPSVTIPRLIKRDQEEAWLTYWIKYGKDFYGFVGCEGGKAPGLASTTLACGNSGAPANGLCGWSLRMSYKLICDPTNPAFGHIRLYMYAYHGLMKGFHGDMWHGTGEGLLQLDRWYCIEEYVKVNTPGVANGIAHFYVNGKLALDRRDVYLRAEKPAEGYGGWLPVTSRNPAPAGATIVTDTFARSFRRSGRVLDSDLAIHQAWMVVHNGGRRAPGKVAQMWIDEIKVSHRRVGCKLAQP